MLEPKEPVDPTIAGALTHLARTAADTHPDPDVRDALLHADAPAAVNQTLGEVRDAVEHAAKRDSAAATAAFQRAIHLAQQYDVSGKEPRLGTRRPSTWELPKYSVSFLHGHLTGEELPKPTPPPAPTPRLDTATPSRASFLKPPG